MKEPEETILVPKEQSEDKVFDLTLRPKHFSEYIGQQSAKDNLQISIAAVQQRQEPHEHVLLYGPAGLGKTTLAHVIAKEMNTNIRVTSGPALEKQGDLASILTNLADKEILFIDEIHRLNRTIEEVLYPAMEDYCLDLVLGKGPSARTLRLDLPKFTLIGATTRIALLSSPLRDRFGVVLHLDFYDENEISQIISRSAKLLGVEISKEAIQEIAKRSRRTPRIANRLLKRVRDFAQVKEKKSIDRETVHSSLDLLRIDSRGLNQADRQLLSSIMEKFQGRPVGINTMAALIAEDPQTIEEIYEPYLLRIGFLERTPRGRRVTNLAYQHLGKSLL